MSQWKTRDFHGFRQHKEIYDQPTQGRRSSNWEFQVKGFNAFGDSTKCNVLTTDGGFQTVPIDAQDRITICGKKYGRNYWNH